MRARNLLISMLLLLPLLILPASAEPLVKVEIFNGSYYESLTVLKPGEDGNWIKMAGGSEVAIPNIKMVYNGINSAQYTKGDKTIKITAYGIQEDEDYVVNYPFTKHSVYYQEDTVTAEILGASDLAGRTAYVYLVRTCPTQLRNALASAVDGDTQPLRNLLDNAIDNTTVTLDSDGDGAVSYGAIGPGDYVVVATLNASTENNITLISATAFEVLEHRSSLDADTSITRSSEEEVKYLEGEFEILGGGDAKYTCVAVLIRKDAEVALKLTSDGTKATTNLTAKVGSAPQEAELVEGFKVAGVGLENVNATTIENWLSAFPPDTVGFSVDRGVGKTYSFKILLKGLSDGDYHLYVAAWNSSNSSQRAVAFDWTSVKITTISPTPTPAPRPPVVGVRPPPGVEVAHSELRTVSANVDVRFDLPPAKAELIGVLAVVFRVPESMTLEVRVSKLASLPAGVPGPPARDVYGYIDITFRKYGTDIEVEPAAGRIEFKVSKSWIAERGYDPATVVLMKYHEGWEELKTELAGEDEKNYYYRAEIGSSSVFAIAVKAVVPATPTPAPPVTPVATPTAAPTATPTPTPAPKPWWRTPEFGAALAVAAALVVVVIVWRWRRRVR